MTFTEKQLAAILKQAFVLAKADGKFTDKEKTAFMFELLKFGVSSDRVQSILELADSMDAAESLAAIATLTLEQKKYVNGFFSAVIVSDGNIDDKELTIWSIISALCDLPEMTLAEALNFWREH